MHLEEGEHEIMLKYKTPGFALGAVVSGGCVAVFLVLLWIRYRRRSVQGGERIAGKIE